MGLDRLVLDYTVSFQVSLQVIEARVSLCTQLTSVRSDPCMVHGVFFQFAATWKTLPTFRAHIRPLPSVNAHMKRHFARHGESSPAYSALVRPFPCVGASVYLQLAGWNKSLATVGAQIRFFSSVGPYVYVQVSWHRETFATVCALKRPLARVTAHVEVQVVFVLEGFATARTNLCSLLPVTQLMGGQTGNGAEEFPTLHALIGQLGRMNLLVGSQLTHTGVHFPTLSACEDTALGVSQLMLNQQVHFLEALSALRTVKLLDTMTTPVSKSVLYRFKAIPTFDANISCFYALCPPVSWQVRGPPEGLSALRAPVRVFSSVQPLMLQEFIAVNEALSTLSAFVCNSLPRRANHRAGQYRTLSRCRRSSAGGRSSVIALLRSVNIRNAVTAFPSCCLLCIAAVQSVCFLLRRATCILHPCVSCLLRRHPLRFPLVFKCFCVGFHIIGVGLSQWRRER